MTYVARGLEPYRGFPDFIRAVAILQRRRPRLVAVVAGGERTWYGPKPPRQCVAAGASSCWTGAGPDLDLDRLVVLPFLPQAHVRDLFRRSDVHIYLTVPFVISWSVLEAMATGCALVAADTPPVREVVEDGRNGLLADMRDPAAIAAAVERLLDDRAVARRLRTAARATILERYALERQLIRQRRLLEQVVNCRTLIRGAAGNPA